MGTNSRNQPVAKTALGVCAGVLVFCATSFLWDVVGRGIIIFSKNTFVPLSSGQTILYSLIVYVPSGLLSGLAFLVAWKVAGKRAGFVAAVLSLVAFLASIVVYIGITRHPWV